jgi:hypothetical protein
LWVYPAFSDDPDRAIDALYYDCYAGTIDDIPKTAALVLAGIREADPMDYSKRMKVLAVLYATGQLPEYESTLKTLDASLAAVLKKTPLTSTLCLAYADYLYAKLSFESKNTKTIMALPVWYRRALFLDPNNREANVKLALWYISAANEHSFTWNAFIQQQEPYIHTLGEVDRFNAYLQYSFFYMKTYKVAQGFFYLDQAKALFPQNPLPALITYNYRSGKLGW